MICAALACLMAFSAFATGMSGTGSGIMDDIGSGIRGAANDVADGLGDMGEMFSDDTLGDRNGDGLIEDQGNAPMMDGADTGGANAPEGVLNTTGRNNTGNGSGMSGSNMSGTNNSGMNNARNGASADSSANAANGSESDGGFSWAGIIVAVLLSAALIAVVIALIPKKEH